MLSSSCTISAGIEERISEDAVHKSVERKLTELPHNKSCVNKIKPKNVTCIKKDDSAKVSSPAKKVVASKSKCPEENIKSKTSPKASKSNETKIGSCSI